jgi:aminobenzoyl-glutamate utilization protein B
MRTFLSITFFCCVFFGVKAQKTKQEVAEAINSKYPTYSGIAKKIWEYAEVGYKEAKSSALLQEALAQAGFKIEKGVAGIPTAFIATYGSGKPVIGILGEYDTMRCLGSLRMQYPK